MLTLGEIVSVSTSVLTAAGYQVASTSAEIGSSRLFEDPYNIVLLSVFDTAESLLSRWADEQAKLVDLIATRLSRTDAKAWDGYLVLLTPGIPSSISDDLESIRRDTNRVRKLVATGDDLVGSGSVERVLSSLLPLNVTTFVGRDASLLERLPGLLLKHGIDQQESAAMIAAFLEQRPIIEALHERESKA